MQQDKHDTEKDLQVKIGITHGDFNGVGYEVILKTLGDKRVCEMCTPLIYGSSKIASYHKKTLTIHDYVLHVVKRTDQLNARRPNIINITNQEAKIELGKSTTQAGNFAFEALKKAIQDVKENKIDVIVTAPINKKNIQSEQFKFPGHTEYLAKSFNVENYLMLMVCNQFRIGTVTGHVPLNQVASILSTKLIMQKISILNNSLIRDFAVRTPKIAILGVNPHAGDKGFLGKEEQELIIPAVEQAQQEDILAFGPFPADGFFGSAQYEKYDAVLAMYHDQGLIPFKALAFQGGVNFTAGLPFVRTSPAHGTAYDIAGKNMASEESFREALFLGIDIFKNRKEFDEINKNPLPFGLASENVVDEDISDIPEEPDN